MRAAILGAIVCLVSWVVLGLTLGNVGLQRSVTDAPAAFSAHPLAVVLPIGCAFLLAASFAYLSRVKRGFGVLATVAVSIGDLFGSVVLAPLAVGELSISDGPAVFTVLSLLGLQPAAVLVGAVIGSAARRRVGRPAGP